jgi:hypothetical protein
LADFLDAHPEIDLSFATHNVYLSSRESLAALARIGGWTKNYSDNYFTLRREFSGEVQLDVYTERDSVCRKVVTGTRVVPAQPATEERVEDVFEWVCDEPLLAGK